MRTLAAWCSVASLALGCDGPMDETLVVPTPPATETALPTAATDVSVGGDNDNATYYGAVRAALAACVSCHGARGPVAPPLHAYAAVRNAIDDVVRALEAGHDGNLSRLAMGCGAASDAGLADLAARVAAWRDAGFPAGSADGTTVPETPEPPPVDATLTAALADDAGPRCYAIGALPGDLSSVTVRATGLAWVELYAVAPAFDAARVALDDGDPATAGWACGADLGLVPQPLVGFWRVGDGALSWPEGPLRAASGATLVARTERLYDASGLASEPPSLAVDLQLAPAEAFATTSVPLRSTAGATLVPWAATRAPLTSIASGPELAELRVDRGADRDCLQVRACEAACDPPPSWPGRSTPPTGTALEPGDRIALTCAGDHPCDASLAVVGDFDATPCDEAAGQCAATCAGDLACVDACALEAGDRCALCALVGALACREAACPSAVTSAWEALGTCAASDDRATCMHEVAAAVASCTGPLCAPALTACGLTPTPDRRSR